MLVAAAVDGAADCGEAVGVAEACDRDSDDAVGSGDCCDGTTPEDAANDSCRR